MCFEEIKGHSHIKEYLNRATALKKIPNSILFSGPRGVGKALFAHNLATLLLYPDGNTAALEEKITSGNHLDLHVFKPEGKTNMHSIASIRALTEQVSMKPFEAKAKVFIVEDAERMLPSSSNALLKTLEEPDLDSFIILLSSNASEMLPTILSRVWHLKLSYLTTSEIVSYLEEKKGIEDARPIAELAKGSIGKACELLESKILPVKRELFFNLLSSKSKGAFKEFLNCANQLEEVYEEESAYEDLETFFLMWWRDLSLIKAGGNSNALFFPDKLEELQKQTKQFNTNSKRFFALLEEMRLSLERNVKLRHVLENFFLKI